MLPPCGKNKKDHLHFLQISLTYYRNTCLILWHEYVVAITEKSQRNLMIIIKHKNIQRITVKRRQVIGIYSHIHLTTHQRTCCTYTNALKLDNQTSFHKPRSPHTGGAAAEEGGRLLLQERWWAHYCPHESSSWRDEEYEVCCRAREGRGRGCYLITFCAWIFHFNCTAPQTSCRCCTEFTAVTKLITSST